MFLHQRKVYNVKSFLQKNLNEILNFRNLSFLIGEFKFFAFLNWIELQALKENSK